jgi:hypothetical protein
MERPPSPEQDVVTPAGPAPDKAAVWEDFLDIFYTPSSVFARREHGSFWIPMLVVSLFIGALVIVNSGVLDPIFDAEFRRRAEKVMADNPRVTPEMMEQQRGIMTTVGTAGGVIGTPFALLLIALLVYVVGKIVGAKQTWHAALVVASYSYVPRILEAVLIGVQGFFVDPAKLDGRYRLTWSAARFLDPDTASPTVLALLGRLDVFTIWVTILLAIGLAVTGRIPRGRAAVAGLIMWALGTIGAVVGGLFS